MNPIVYFLIVGILILVAVVGVIASRRLEEPMYVFGLPLVAVALPTLLAGSWAMSSEYQRIEGTVIEVRPSASFDSSNSLLVKRADGQGMMTPLADRGSDHPRTGDQVVVITNQLGLISGVETLQK